MGSDENVPIVDLATGTVDPISASDTLIVIGYDGKPATTIDSAGVISLMEQRGALQLEAAALRNTLKERDREIERLKHKLRYTNF